MDILILAKIRFIFVVELPLLSYVISVSCPLTSSSTQMHVIKIPKDVSFCQDCGSLSTMPATTRLSPILRSPTLSFGFSYVGSMCLNLLKIDGANTIIMEITQRETEWCF